MKSVPMRGSAGSKVHITIHSGDEVPYRQRGANGAHQSCNQKPIVVSNGFAACCEEWLCLSVELALSSGLRP